MKARHLLLSIAGFFAFPLLAYGTTYYVNNCGDDTCNGQYAACWSQGVTNCAKKTIQAGMNLGQAGDTILVAAGTYTGPGNRDLEFSPGGTVARSITVKCASCPERCIIDVQGSNPCDSTSPPPLADQHRGFRFDNDGATNASVIDGFTIRNGCVWTTTSPPGPGGYGGAIFIDGAAPTIRRCIIENNKARFGGGGIALEQNVPFPVVLVPVIEDCIIRNNETTDMFDLGGGGIWVGTHMDAMVKNTTISGNSTDENGGGIYWGVGSNARMDRCVVEGNTAGYSGGGVYMGFVKDEAEGDPGRHIVRSQIGPGNVATNGPGGGIRVDTAWVGETAPLDLYIENCTIIDNRAPASYGGGVSFFGGWSDSPVAPRVVNTIFAGNTATKGGAIHVLQFVEATLANVTMMHNTASGTAGGSAIFFESERTCTVSNSVLWYAASPPAQSQVLLGSSMLYRNQLTVQRSDVQGGLPQYVNNLFNISPALDPLFVDPDGPDNIVTTFLDNDYHLQDESPCNDRGNVLLVPTDDLDLDTDGVITERVPLDRDDRDRYVDDPPGPYLGVIDPPNGYTEYVDMGAYEFAVAVAQAPTRPTSGQASFDKNRYLSILPENAGSVTALRVTLAKSCVAPEHVGKQWWVEEPFKVCETGAQSVALPNCGTASGLPKWFWAAKLVCDRASAAEMDWSTLKNYCSIKGEPCATDSDCPPASGACGVDGIVHVSAVPIVPAIWVSQGTVLPTIYHVQAIHASSDAADESNFSAPLSLGMSRWGDIVTGNAGTPPDGLVTVTDVCAMLDKFSGVSGAAIKARSDLAPWDVNWLIYSNDITSVLDAQNSLPYPNTFPCECPSCPSCWWCAP